MAFPLMLTLPITAWSRQARYGEAEVSAINLQSCPTWAGLSSQPGRLFPQSSAGIEGRLPPCLYLAKAPSEALGSELYGLDGIPHRRYHTCIPWTRLTSQLASPT